VRAGLGAIIGKDREAVAHMRSIVALIGMLAAATLIGGAAFGKDNFDPSGCKTGARDTVYIALGVHVFAVPLGGIDIGDPISPSMKLTRLQPPDPTEPEGCLGNPQQMQSYGAFGSPGRAQKPGVRQQAYPTTDFLELIRLTRPDGEWSGEQSQLSVTDEICKRAQVHEELPDGLAACRYAPKEGWRIEDWAASYIARHDVYATPLGRPFVVNCGQLTFTYAINDCTVAYIVMPELGIMYRFHPFHTEHAIPIDQIIEFDRHLRQQILAALVPNYTWPQSNFPQSESKPEGKP
jgi:hypothetical protein